MTSFSGITLTCSGITRHHTVKIGQVVCMFIYVCMCVCVRARSRVCVQHVFCARFIAVPSITSVLACSQHNTSWVPPIPLAHTLRSSNGQRCAWALRL